MIKIISVIIVLLSAAIFLGTVYSSSEPQNPRDKADKAYSNGDYVGAYQGYLSLADRGDAIAQYHLGYLHYVGKGVPQDYSEAMKWFTKAAEQGHPEAQTNTGAMYQHGQGVPQNFEEALKRYTIAANKGLPQAQFNIGVMYDKGEGVPQSFEEAVNWYRKAAEQGFPQAQHNIGTVYYLGKGVSLNYKEAANWYRKAANKGFPQAQNNMGVIYQNGEGVPQSFEEAISWYTKAAKQGYSDAQHALDYLREKGMDINLDKPNSKGHSLAAALPEEQEQARAVIGEMRRLKNGESRTIVLSGSVALYFHRDILTGRGTCDFHFNSQPLYSDNDVSEFIFPAGNSSKKGYIMFSSALTWGGILYRVNSEASILSFPNPDHVDTIRLVLDESNAVHSLSELSKNSYKDGYSTANISEKRFASLWNKISKTDRLTLATNSRYAQAYNLSMLSNAMYISEYLCGVDAKL